MKLEVMPVTTLRHALRLIQVRLVMSAITPAYRLRAAGMAEQPR